MIFRRLGNSGLRVPALSFGTGTFGGKGEFFAAWGNSDAAGAERIVDICLDHGVSLFDTADVYSGGLAEEILGAAIKGRRNRVLISTKATLPSGDGPNDYGSSRQHLIEAVDGSLKRLGVDHIDLFQLHTQDNNTPVEETLSTLGALVQAGKIRYLGVSNFSAWRLMKSLAVSERHGWPRYIAHQVHYSLLNRDYEWELAPLGEDEGVGAIVWSPLSWGMLTGKVRRDRPAPADARVHSQADKSPPFDENSLFAIVDVLDGIAKENGNSISQIAINWLLQRPTVANVIIGARNEAQLVENIGALEVKLSEDQMSRLETVSARQPIYPLWHHHLFPMLDEKRQS